MARYIPILRWKRGERVGVTKLSTAARQNVAPLIVVGTDQFKAKKATQKAAAVPAPDRLAQDILADWGAEPFHLDASAIAHAGAGAHLFSAIAQSCRSAGLKMIPATTLSAPANYQQAVLTAAKTDQRGIVMRTDLQGMTSASSWAPTLPLPLAQFDLLVDFAGGVGSALALGASLTHAFQNLYGAGQWRSVSVSGTSMPDNFGGMTAGLHLIPRAEIQIWQMLASSKLPYQIDYGDYATVPLVAPPSGIAWGYPINVRYTLPKEFLICRGVGTTGFGGVDLDVQLIDHAKRIVAYPTRNPLNCWADQRIDGIAAGTYPPSGLEHWVQIGVCRHVESVRSNLP